MPINSSDMRLGWRQKFLEISVVEFMEIVKISVCVGFGNISVCGLIKGKNTRRRLRNSGQKLRGTLRKANDSEAKDNLQMPH